MAELAADSSSPSSAASTSDSDAFFDAPDSLPSPPPPQTPLSSSLRRRLRPRPAAPSDALPRRSKLLRDPKPSTSTSASTITTAADAEAEPAKPDASEATSSPPAPPEPAPPEEGTPASLLESVAGFVVGGVFFQVGVLISCLTFPIWLLQWWFVLVTDPLGAARRAREGASAWVWDVLGKAGGYVGVRMGPGQGAGRVAARLAWGTLWAVYVCSVLLALLAMAFLGGALLVGKIVEEPVQVTESLNFDYTKANPVASVPMRRLVPPNQRMQLTVSLTLPESDYNRRLGVFQVRAEFLSADGKVISSASQPCMLKFKSSYMHFIETFLRSVSLLSGYSSESQVITLKMRGIKEGTEPTTGVRIILEQRAEFSPGAGIPEIYAASLKLESELPLLKRILWSWRWTLFVWSSMGLFVFELLLALVCCRPVVVPRSAQNAGAP